MMAVFNTFIKIFGIAKDSHLLTIKWTPPFA